MERRMAESAKNASSKRTGLITKLEGDSRRDEGKKGRGRDDAEKGGGKRRATKKSENLDIISDQIQKRTTGHRGKKGRKIAPRNIRAEEKGKEMEDLRFGVGFRDPPRKNRRKEDLKIRPQVNSGKTKRNRGEDPLQAVKNRERQESPPSRQGGI